MKDIDINKIKEEIKEVGHKTDFIVSWFAKKYNKVLFRPGNLNEVGCRTWTHATNGDKYLCFYDTLKDRYTTAINPMITFKKKVN